MNRRQLLQAAAAIPAAAIPAIAAIPQLRLKPPLKITFSIGKSDAVVGQPVIHILVPPRATESEIQQVVSYWKKLLRSETPRLSRRRRGLCKAASSFLRTPVAPKDIAVWLSIGEHPKGSWPAEFRDDRYMGLDAIRLF